MRAPHLARLLTRLALLGSAVYLAAVFGGRFLNSRRPNLRNESKESEARQSFLHTYGADDVRILQFYARDREVVEGRSTVLCYGVLNAKAVKLDPPMEGVGPALNRCVEVAPLRETRYTLTAEDANGRTVSESFSLPVVADTAALPRIVSFGVVQRGVDRGRPYFKLAFTVENAETVDVDPPVIPTLHRAPLGQFVVAPTKTTTYTLTVTGKHGHKTSREVKVSVDAQVRTGSPQFEGHGTGFDTIGDRPLGS